MNKGCKTHNRVWKNLAWAEEEGRREYLQPGRPLSNYSMVSFDIKVTPNFEGLGALLPFQDLIKFGEGFSSKASNLSYWKKKKKEMRSLYLLQLSLVWHLEMLPVPAVLPVPTACSEILCSNRHFVISPWPQLHHLVEFPFPASARLVDG